MRGRKLCVDPGRCVGQGSVYVVALMAADNEQLVTVVVLEQEDVVVPVAVVAVGVGQVDVGDHPPVAGQGAGFHQGSFLVRAGCPLDPAG